MAEAVCSPSRVNVQDAATQLSFLIGCCSPTYHTVLDVGCRVVLPRLPSLGAAEQLDRAPWDSVNVILKDCGYPKGP
jgi:hypothetical protein